jgi:hypothetical protein
MRSIRLAFPLFLAMLATPLAAQTVRGVVVDAEARPVAGMVVSLHGSADGAARAGGLTGADGRFSIRARAPGRYTLRAERIGYQRVETPVEVADGETVEVRLTAAVEAFVLAPLQVETDERCVVRPGVGLQAYELWQQAATALRATALAQDQALVEYTVRTYSSELVGARSRRRTDPPRRVTGSPFQTLEPAALARHGYMRENGSSFAFYGPDARVLLSDEFLDTHCLYVRRDGDEVGVAFEPVDGRTAVDIHGVLWLNARTGELREVEYKYTGVAAGGRASSSGGRIEFQRQRSGAWIVSRWYIRAAHVQQDPRAGQTVIASFLEAGGEVTNARVAGEDAGR